MQHRDDARFKFVAAAHHFIADATPFRDDASHAALGAFLKSAESAHLATLELDAVLLRTLAILDRHSAGRLPTMVKQTVGGVRWIPTVLKRFQECVEDVLRYRGIGSRRWCSGQSRSSSVGTSDSTLSAKVIADALGMTPERLAPAFTGQTGMNTKYLRNFRLIARSPCSESSDKSVKEVWAAVGYNHASNFDHDFRDRFGQSPRQFRTRGVFAHAGRPAADHPPGAAMRRPVSDDRERSSSSTMIAAHARRSAAISAEGYRVTSVENGAAGLIEAEQHKPDAVLLDYHLPDVDGLEWLRLFIAPAEDARRDVLGRLEFERELDELTALDASLLSKLCDLEDVRDALEGGRSNQARL